MMNADDLEEFARDLGEIPGRLVPRVKGVVSKGSVNIKNQLRREAQSSSSFKQIATTIGFDLKQFSFAGDGVTESHIGPSTADGPAASLAGVAYFGSSRPGGGTLRDPIHALKEEEPHFIKALEDLVEGTFK